MKSSLDKTKVMGWTATMLFGAIVWSTIASIIVGSSFFVGAFLRSVAYVLFGV